MMMASAANAAGGASIIKAAFGAAHARMEGGMGMFAETQLRQDTPLGGLVKAMETPSRFVAEMGPHLTHGRVGAVKSGLASQGGRSANPRRKSRLGHSLQYSRAAIQGQRTFLQFSASFTAGLDLTPTAVVVVGSTLLEVVIVLLWSRVTLSLQPLSFFFSSNMISCSSASCPPYLNLLIDDLGAISLESVSKSTECKSICAARNFSVGPNRIGATRAFLV